MMLLYMVYFCGILTAIVAVASVGKETWQGNATSPLGGIQEALQILQGNVLTLTKLTNVINQKVDSNTLTVTLLKDKVDATMATVSKFHHQVAATSEAVSLLSDKVDVTSSDLKSLKKDVHLKFGSVDAKLIAVNTKVDSKVARISRTVESNCKSIQSFSGYCNLQPENVCGPCMCRDDPNLLENHYCDCSHLPAKRDCQQFHMEGAKINGIYTIHQNNLRIIRVFCDQQTDGGGWTVFQRRADGSEKFYRDWQNYRNGFGSLQNEFWLGNRNLYTLTSQGIMGNELRVEIGDWFGTRKFAKYSSFQIGNEAAKFPLFVARYSGNAGDSMSVHSGHEFTTFDNDNDRSIDNCAIRYFGAWWYRWTNDCFSCNLNGVYYDYGRMGRSSTGVHWFGWHYDANFSFKFTEMKTRRIV